MDVHEAFYRVVHDYKAGVPALAAKMGVPPGTLYNKADPGNEGHHKPSMADCVVATLLTGDKRIVQAMCRTVGGIYLDLPDLSGFDTDQLMSHILRIGREEGDFFDEIDNALSGDNRISPDEFKRIDKEAHEFVAAILEALQRMREMAGVDK
jgi:hypothetical protein